MVSGLAREDVFVPSRRFREDGLLIEAINLSPGGGRGGVNTLGAPAVAKQTKPIDSDSLQAQVELVVRTP